MKVLAQLAIVMLGGALGSGLRFLTALGYARWTRISSFPIATFTVNMAGCFLITLIAELAISTSIVSAEVRLFLTVGVMGGLTTYSSFNHDLIEALRRSDYAAAGLSATVTLIACLVAGFLGLATAKALLRH